MAPLRLAVLLSGSGTTLQNLVDRSREGEGSMPAEIVLVLSSKADAFGLERARRAGLATAVVSRKQAGSLETFSEQIFGACREARAELVCMAGWLHLVAIPDDYLGRVMNIHPALIPAFSGEGYFGHRVHEAVLAYGTKVSGCTVHFADNEYDHGPIILQRGARAGRRHACELGVQGLRAGVRGVSGGDKAFRGGNVED